MINGEIDKMQGINNSEDEYNISNGDILLDNEDGQLDPSVYPQDERIYPMKSIKVERGFYTAYELKRKYDKVPSLVVLDSDFQRESVWKLQQKRELIESVLMGLPLPIFYFNEDKTGRLIVIDGRQRLSTIFEFLNNGFSLDNLKILDEFNKKKFKDLDPIYQSKIEDYQIMAHVIQPMTPDRVKFDIFDRVNRAGTQLNKQEIRNALYQGKSTALLNTLSKTEVFNEATEHYFLKDTRMKNRYLLLRFIAFYLYYNQKLYNNNIRSGELFRLIDVNQDGTVKRYPININIFETFMYAMTLLPYRKHEIRDDLRQAIGTLKNDPGFRDSLNNHRDSDIKVKYRYDKIMELVGGFL